MKTILDLFNEANINIITQTTVSGRGRELKGNCPICGGKDRLRIQPDLGKYGFFECRQCSEFRGNSVNFCMKYLNMDNVAEAMKYITGVSKSIYKGPIKIPPPVHKPTTIKKPTPEWIKQITKITNDAHQYLLQAYDYDIKGTPLHKKKYSMQRDIMLFLLLRGITEDTIKEFKIGYNPEFIKLSPNSKTIYVPPGITIPFQDPTLKLKIKGHIPSLIENPEHRFSITAEGQNGLSHILRNTDNIIITEAELDMYTLYSQLGDNFSYFASGNNLSLPDNHLHPITKDCTNLFICHDNDPAGTTMYMRYKKEYPHAKSTPTPKGKDPAEAYAQRINLKTFFMEKICLIQ